MTFRGGEVLQGKLIGGKILEGWIEARVNLQCARKLAIGGGEISLLSESDSQKIASFEIARLRLKNRLPNSDSLRGMALTDQSFCFCIGVSRLSMAGLPAEQKCQEQARGQTLNQGCWQFLVSGCLYSASCSW